MHNTRYCLFVLIFCSIINSLFASTTGKIAGVITDSQNGEPLVGVNVFIEGTTFGAASDLEGYFVLLNIPPGKYTVNLSYIGYTDYQIRDLVVRIDLTTRVDVSLSQEILETDIVVVEAIRPVINRDVSNSQMNIEAKVIESLPVRNIDRVLTLQAGIENGTDGIIVRGGGANQTVFMVDGLSTNDERSSIPYTTMSLSSIEEIKIQTGGFNAEYGDARSGLINVVTREGKNDKYSGSIIFNYRGAAPKHLGGSIYRSDSYFNKPYLDPAVCWTGTANGAWDENTRKQYPNFEGWNAVSEKTLQDKDPSNDLTPVGAQRLFTWQRRRAGDIDKPDYVFDAGFGGPVPFIGKYLGNLRFYLSHFSERDMFIFPLSYDGFNDSNTSLKFTSDISPSMKLNINGSYGRTQSVTEYQWTTTPTGSILRGDSEIADLVNSNSGASILYMPGYFTPTDIDRIYIGFKFTHALNPRLYYDIRGQFKTSEYNSYQTQSRDLALKYEPIPGYKVDEAPFGYDGYSSSAIEGTSMGGWMNLGRDSTINSTYSLALDVTNQINSMNQLKAGFSFVYNDFDIKSSTYSPSMNTWTRNMIYRVFPYRIGVYIQDKLEFEAFIANVGVRLDYSNSNTKTFVLGTYDEAYKAGYGNSLENTAPTTESKSDLYISPRIGISHPITNNSKLYFNYNHFRSEVSSAQRFRLQRESNGLVTQMGNPDLVLEKTVAYELGYEHNLFSDLLLKLAAYYKDITNQPGSVYYENIDATVQYSITENNNYYDIRGFEVTLSKHGGDWIDGFINYTYDVRTSGYFGVRQNYQDPNKQREYERLNPYISRPHPRPYARANISLKSPQDTGPEWGGIWPLSNWYLNLLADWRSGSYYLYQLTEKIEYDVQWKDWINLDLRLAKVFQLGKLFNLQLYIDMTNVFNFKYMNYAGFSDNYDWESYLESLNFSWETGDRKGDDKIGDYRAPGVAFDPLEPNANNDPAITARNNARKENKSYIDMPNIQSFTFLNPRNIIFGVRINF